jgi:hypothetical protein
MAIVRDSFDVPYRDRLVERGGFLTNTWQGLFRTLFDRVYPLGSERQFTLENNQSTPAAITELKVNSRAVSQATIDYLIQRVTTGGSAVQLIESGVFVLTYNPTDSDWNIHVINEELPDDAGVDFTVDEDGQVKYTSTDITGTPSISRIIWRMRTLAGKSAQYSSAGVR